MTASDIADMKADFATARGDAANGIAQMKADVATAVDEARTAAGVALAAEKNTATQALSAQTASLKAELAELVASTDKDRKKFVADDAKAQQDAADAVGTMQADVQRALSTLDQGDDVLAQEKSRSQHDLAKLNAVRAGAWDEYVIDVEARIAAIIAAAQYEQALADLEGALQGSARMKAEWIRENLGEAAYRQHLEEKLATLKWGRDATSYLLSVLPGTGALLDLTTGVTGEDINGDTVGGGERALAGISAFGAAVGLGATDEVFDGFRAVGKTRKRTANLVDKAGDVGGGVRKAPRRITQGKWGAKIDYNSGVQRAIDHIKDGHFFNSRAGARSSRFSASNSTTSRVKNLVDDAIAKGRHSTNNRGDYSVLHTFDDAIGTDINGRKTKTIQVFLDELGNILNAYPVPRP